MLKFLAFLLRATVAVFAGTMFLAALFVDVAVVARDLWRARRGLFTTTLRCPRGHDVPTANLIVRCETCKWVWHGSIMQCENPECRATTVAVTCPECGLSVRSPYRWGMGAP